MAGSSDTTVVQTKSETNVVMGAVARLKAVFAERGFGPESSKQKMHAAADMLMNGISADSLSSDRNDYSSETRPVAVVLADADIAMRHIDQTRRAAEIYLDVVASDEPVEEELESLQAALLVCERAVLTFKQSLDEEQVDELEPLKASVDGLRDITDKFGDRVRQTRLSPSEEDVSDT